MHDTTAKVDVSAMNRAIACVLACGNRKPMPTHPRRKAREKRMQPNVAGKRVSGAGDR